MKQAVQEINAIRPDMVVVAGDLTAGGYRDEFEQAKEYLAKIDCSQVLVIAGNHDHRNLGFLHFEDLFGHRYKSVSYDFCLLCGEEVQETLKIVAADSNKPDLDDGEIGREHYTWLEMEFAESKSFKIFVLHHHLVSIPGTGRERNIVWDAGDVLAKLRFVGVDLVLCGHRHVPYIWPVANMLVISSGTVSTGRTRGYTQPSYNIIQINPETITVSVKTPGQSASKVETFSRRQLS
jgi:3',5'-cyclic AMP phosphodiesterase CpdA